MASPKVYINGKLYDKADAKISVYDHGLLYGDGVFEGIRVYDGKVFKLKEHVDRLFESARAIKLEIPMTRASVPTRRSSSSSMTSACTRRSCTRMAWRSRRSRRSATTRRRSTRGSSR